MRPNVKWQPEDPFGPLGNHWRFCRRNFSGQHRMDNLPTTHDGGLFCLGMFFEGTPAV